MMQKKKKERRKTNTSVRSMQVAARISSCVAIVGQTRYFLPATSKLLQLLRPMSKVQSHLTSLLKASSLKTRQQHAIYLIPSNSAMYYTRIACLVRRVDLGSRIGSKVNESFVFHAFLKVSHVSLKILLCDRNISRTFPLVHTNRSGLIRESNHEFPTKWQFFLYVTDRYRRFDHYCVLR